MSTPFLGEVKIFSFPNVPQGWAQCNGQFMPINQNQALFSLLGTTYGGNGQTTFALPDLRGRVPIHRGSGFTLGVGGGQEVHTLTQNEMPAHTHFAQAASNQANTALPAGNYLAQALNLYHSPDSLTSLNPTVVSNYGGSQPHNNMQPFLVLNICIALIGIFPSRN